MDASTKKIQADVYANRESEALFYANQLANYIRTTPVMNPQNANTPYDVSVGVMMPKYYPIEQAWFCSIIIDIAVNLKVVGGTGAGLSIGLPPIDCEFSTFGPIGEDYNDVGVHWWIDSCKAFVDPNPPATPDPLPPIPTPPSSLNTKMELIFWSATEPVLKVDDALVTMIDIGDGAWAYGQDNDPTSVKLDVSNVANHDITAIVIQNYAVGGSLSNAFSHLPNLEVFAAPYNLTGTIYINAMLRDCPKLKRVELGDVSHINHFGWLFSDCTSLQILPPMNTVSGEMFNSMFKGCTGLLFVCGIDTTHQHSTIEMFEGADNLQSPNAAEQAAILAGTDFTSISCP